MYQQNLNKCQMKIEKPSLASNKQKNNQSLKLIIEMGNVSKRQQPDQRADNNQRPPFGLHCNEKLPYPGGDSAGL